MSLIDFSASMLSILPAAVALGLAIITRRVLISLGIGIILGALLLVDYSIVDAGKYIFSTVKSVVV